MNLTFISTTLLVITTAATALGLALINTHPFAEQQRQVSFGAASREFGSSLSPVSNMDTHYIFDMGAKGLPTLGDILARERSATIAMDAILRSEPLMRAINGDSADFRDGLTLLLPTNRAFSKLDSLPEDLESVMRRHFIPQIVTSQQMKRGAKANSYQKLATLHFMSSQGKLYVQADQRNPVEVRGAGLQARGGIYFLVDELFV
ncbi:hypothetical protein COEREDRAFT_5429 [Coemansia reversa NRRL 1564]|uniref:FAS1 domain-containing protein n=1 Tax=Coemansia reversa (strain ATCC 12441 / NRRL 1564) TaxID=763665 RepID=A0A2G5BKS1_COERN|nr:hypothetical protein COEREDRAFT_5429 [Coemansia reversa NRRL 1564]|eukprot:PIA19603.1 hypothetical protein COEREDRAFT_5429 [Coemansia reversa NRRL 1564]